MRKLVSLAALASSALVLGAGQAKALSSIDLTYLGGASGAVGEDSLVTADGDTLRFAVTIHVDSTGVSAWDFDLVWDRDGENELNLASVRLRSEFTLQADPGPPPLSVTYDVWPLAGTRESTTLASFQASSEEFFNHGFPQAEGHIWGINAQATTVTGPYPASLSFRVGIVEFRLNSANNNPGPDIQLGYFKVHGGFGDKDFNNITPNFGSFQVDPIPEPGPSLMIAVAVLGLILLGRPRRQS